MHWDRSVDICVHGEIITVIKLIGVPHIGTVPGLQFKSLAHFELIVA